MLVWDAEHRLDLKVMDKLQHVQNAAVRLVTGTWKHEHGLSRLMHDDLCWLGYFSVMQYKLAVTVHRCLRYLTDYCVPVSEVAGHSGHCDLPDVINCQFCKFATEPLDPCIFCRRTKSLEFTA